MAEKARNKKILLVEDEDSLRKIFFEMLNRAGYFVIDARHGLEALEKLDSDSYDLVLTDIDMPFVDGVDLYLSSIHKFPHMKNRFLFMSGSFSREVLENRSVIVKRFLIKPFRSTDLITSVDSMLRGLAAGGDGNQADGPRA